MSRAKAESIARQAMQAIAPSLCQNITTPPVERRPHPHPHATMQVAIAFKPRDGPSVNGSSPPAGFSEAEAKPHRRIDRAPIEEAVCQAAIDLREHDPGVGIELLRKLPIDHERNGVERPMAVCERRGVGGAIDRCTKGRLAVMIISADHIQIVSDGVFHSGPENME